MMFDGRHIWMRGGRVVPRTVADVIDRVEKVESELGIPEKNKRWFVASLSSIRELTSIAALGCVFYPGRIVQSRVGANHIRVKNNIISFYTSEEKAIKIFEDSQSMNRHLEGKTHAQEFKFLRVPDTYLHASENIPYVVEQLIPGVKLKRRYMKGLSNTVINDLKKFHFRNAKVKKIVVSSCDIDVVAAKMRDAGIKHLQFLDLIGRHLPIKSFLVEGRVHGDLSPGNMIFDGDYIWILDWEKYGVGPIAGDIKKLIHIFPGISDEYNREFKRIGNSVGISIPPLKEQVTMIEIKRIVKGNSPSRSYFSNKKGSKSEYKNAMVNILRQIENTDVHWMVHH